MQIKNLIKKRCKDINWQMGMYIGFYCKKHKHWWNPYNNLNCPLCIKNNLINKLNKKT